MPRITDGPSRTTLEELVKFRGHRADWKAGKIRLLDHVAQWQEQGGKAVPLWYPAPLGFKVAVDKAAVFGAIGYFPSLPQCKFHGDASAKVLLFVGGARGGKSRAGAMEMLPVLLTPGTNQWIVAPEYGQAVKEFGYIEEALKSEALWPHVKPFLKRCVCRPDQGDMEIKLRWREGLESFVLVKTEKVQRSLLSEELDQVLMVEASELKRSTWTKYVRARLITRDGRAIFPTSPNGLGWVAELEKLGDVRKGGCYTVHSDTRFNPTVDPEVVDFWGKEMSDQEWAEQILGIATPKSGLVYPEFRVETHVEPWDKTWPKESWTRWRGLDFGYTNPLACLWVAEDEDGRVYVYRELYRPGMLTNQVVEKIAEAEGRETVQDRKTGMVKLRPGGGGEQIKLTIADWDAQQCAELRVRGFRIRKARKDVEAGVMAVRSFLLPRGDGRPGLYVSPECTNTILEMSLYQWPEPVGNRDVDAKEVPLKANDHAMDALRYLIFSVFNMRRRHAGRRKPEKPRGEISGKNLFGPLTGSNPFLPV